MRRHLVTLFVVLLTVVLGVGCQHLKEELPPAALEQPVFSEEIRSGLDVIRVGDTLYITFSDIPDNIEIKQQRVREDGTITLPFDKTIVAAGKTIKQLEEDIKQLYVPSIYRRLTVRVEAYERTFYVGGQVRMPGRYPYQGQMTVLQAIRVAGDFTEFANRRKVRITRANGTTFIVDCKRALKDPKYDVAIFPGDSIYVERSIW